MRKLIIIILMCYSPLFCGEWTHISTLEIDPVWPKIEAVDNNNIMISGNRGSISPHIYKSLDRAKTWQTVLQDTAIEDLKGKVIYHPNRAFDFEYLDSLHAIMMCKGLRYWRTEDGGNNWTHDSLLSNKTGGSEVISNKNLLYTHYNEYHISSKDFGRTWNNYIALFDKNFDLEKGNVFISSSTFFNDSIIIGDGLYLVDIYSPENVYFIAKSTDLGKNWEITYIKEFQTFLNFTEANSKIISVGSQQTKPGASTYRDIISISEDGGYTWRTVMDTIANPSSKLHEVEFINENDGITYSRDFDKLYRTSDGGETWYRDYGIQDFDYPPYDYEYLPNGEILAVSRTGKVYKWTDPKLSVEEDARPIEPKKEIEIYPNPVPQSQEINIKFNPTIYGFATISIVNIHGKEISSYEVNLQARDEHLRFKPINDLAQGSYFLQIEYRNGIIERQSFVVE